MPARNSVKVYIENGYYHIYNRGVDKRTIFEDKEDYVVFLHFLKRYLTEQIPSPDKISPTWRIDLFDKVKLLAYCLMPNHFHLLLKQTEKKAITDFMRALANSYVRYFNEKYERQGTLFQGIFKGVLIENDNYLLHLTRYIHLNPLEVQPPNGCNLFKNLSEYSYSSYGEYLGMRKTIWIHPEEVLSFFNNPQRSSLKDILSYQSFVEDFKENPKEILNTLAID